MLHPARLGRRLIPYALGLLTACMPKQAEKVETPDMTIQRFDGQDHACPIGTIRREDVWPAHDQIRGSTARWCERADGTRHGPYAAWWDNHARQHQGQYRDGVKHGTWRLYHHDGVMFQTEEWHDGEPVSVNGQPVVVDLVPASTIRHQSDDG